MLPVSPRQGPGRPPGLPAAEPRTALRPPPQVPKDQLRQCLERWVNKASNRAHAEEVKNRILASLSTGRLDLRNCRARAVIELPTELINALPRLRAIALPRSVEQWPPGNGGIYRSGLNSELVISGPDLTLVRVDGGTHVRSGGRGKKIKVTYHDASGTERGAGVAHGNAYYARKNGSIDFSNINGVFAFGNQNDPRGPGGHTIVCRHLALFEALMRQRHEQEKKSVGKTANWAACREERLKHIASAQNANLELRYKELFAHAPEQYLVGHREWGQFLHDQFARMQPEETKSIVVSSQSHAMTLTLKTKIKDGAAHYVVEFYDPNDTYTHIRIERDSLSSLRDLSMQLLLPNERIDYYYKTARSHNHVPFSVLAVLPADAHCKALSDEWFSHSVPSTVKEFLTAQERTDPLRFYALARASAPLDGLYDAAAACPDRGSRVALLKLQGPNSGSGFADALANAATATVTEYGSVLLRARENSLINNDDLGVLLELGAEGARAGPPEEEQANTLRALAEIARQARERGWLNAGACGRVLAAPLRMSAQFGPTGAIRQICDGVLKGNKLTPADAAALFTPGIVARAVQGCIYGSVEASDSVEPLMDAVTSAKVAGLLTEKEVVDILRIKIDQSTLASFGESPDAVFTVWGLAVLKACERGALSSEGLAELMLPEDPGVVCSNVEPKKMQEHFKAWAAVTNTALQRRWLTQDQIARRLISRKPLGPWLACALEGRASEATIANYRQLISGLELNSKSRTTVRRELNSAVRGWFGRRRPQFRDADHQAWQQYKQVLSSLK